MLVFGPWSSIHVLHNRLVLARSNFRDNVVMDQIRSNFKAGIYSCTRRKLLTRKTLFLFISFLVVQVVRILYVSYTFLCYSYKNVPILL